MKPFSKDWQMLSECRVKFVKQSCKCTLLSVKVVSSGQIDSTYSLVPCSNPFIISPLMLSQVHTLHFLDRLLGGERRGEMAGVASPRKQADSVTHCLNHLPCKCPAVSAPPHQLLTHLALGLLSFVHLSSSHCFLSENHFFSQQRQLQFYFQEMNYFHISLLFVSKFCCLTGSLP